MRIPVPTIQHTGSWFIVYHVLKDYLHNGKDSLHSRLAGDGVVFHHTQDPYIDAIRRELDQRRGIAPLRHPEAIWASWTTRGKDKADLFLQTRHMVSIADHPNLVFIPIDHDDREKYLAKASEHLGIPLSTDWRVVHKFDGDARPKETGDYDEYIAEFGLFFSRFYKIN